MSKHQFLNHIEELDYIIFIQKTRICSYKTTIIFIDADQNHILETSTDQIKDIIDVSGVGFIDCLWFGTWLKPDDIAHDHNL